MALKALKPSKLSLTGVSTAGMQKLKKTYSYVFLGLFLCSIGCIIGLPVAESLSGYKWLLVAAEFGALFLFMFKKNIFTYSLFTFLSGITLIPIIYSFLQVGLGLVIIKALVGTLTVVGLLTFYALSTKKDYMKFSTILFYVLIGLIVLMILNIFFGTSLISFLISCFAIVLFSFYLIVHTQEVLYTDIEPLDAAMNLYLDILNIFVSLLQILGFLEKDN